MGSSKHTLPEPSNQLWQLRVCAIYRQTGEVEYIQGWGGGGGLGGYGLQIQKVIQVPVPNLAITESTFSVVNRTGTLYAFPEDLEVSV